MTIIKTPTGEPEPELEGSGETPPAGEPYDPCDSDVDCSFLEGSGETPPPGEPYDPCDSDVDCSFLEGSGETPVIGEADSFDPCATVVNCTTIAQVPAINEPAHVQSTADVVGADVVASVVVAVVAKRMRSYFRGRVR